MQVDVENLRRECRHKVFGKRQVLVLESSRHLRGVSVSMEEPAQNSICPFLGFPPFALLPFFEVFWYSILREPQVDDGKQKLTPRHQTLGTLLMSAKIDNNC